MFVGIDVERGWGQIVAEFLPIRTEQLLGSLYGPTGTNKLLPPAQPSDAVSVAQPTRATAQTVLVVWQAMSVC